MKGRFDTSSKVHAALSHHGSGAQLVVSLRVILSRQLLMVDNLLFVSPWCAFACVFVVATVAGPAGGGGEAGGSHCC